ncbi:MAG: DeoR/GlpR family DNA-binding transcription regulator [Brevinema sp.]
MNFEHRYKILNFVERSEEASVTELASLCNVTLPTIRKYLKNLNDNNMLIFTRGKVRKIPKHKESLLGWRLDDNRMAKEQIGEKIGDIVQDGETIFLGAGSTTFYCLPYLITKKNLTVVTNSLHVINFLVRYPYIRLICTGGQWNQQSDSFLGFYKNFTSFHPHRSFIGALSLDITKGITQRGEVNNEDEFIIFQQALKQYIVADTTKFLRSLPWTVLPTSQIQNIITDTPPKNIQQWLDQGVSIL